MYVFGVWFTLRVGLLVVGVYRIKHRITKWFFHLNSVGQRLEGELFTVAFLSNNFIPNCLCLELDKHHLEFFSRDNLLFNQCLRQFFQQFSIVLKDLLGSKVRVVDKTFNLGINTSLDLGTPGGRSLKHLHSHERSATRGLRNGNTSDLVAHSPFGNHALGNTGNLLDIVGGTGGDHVLSVDKFFGKTSTKGNGKLRFKVLFAVKSRFKTRFLRGEESKSTGTVGTGDDSNLLHLIVIRDKGTNNSVTSLVVGNKFLLLGNLVTSLLFKTNHDTVNGSINLFPSNGRLLGTSGGNGGFVHEVLKLSSRETGSTTRDGFKIDIGFKRLTTGVDTKDTGTALEIRKVDSDLTIETSRTEKSLIKNVDTVSGGNGDNSGVSIETIHLNKDLVDSLFTFIVTTGETSTTLTTDGINLINEDNTGSILLGLSEDITDTGGTHTNEHLYEFRTRDGDEGNTSLTGNSLGEEGLTGTGRTIKDNTTGNTASVLGVGLRLLEEINNLRKL
mmetsp:Transcript_3657/g.4370  ORF Transcript_3657/g.4370 Transcript_3657/m.4370 type:complete len:502 (-) Transcript_3657:409-1914(-)